jgi:hypothetical protein
MININAVVLTNTVKQLVCAKTYNEVTAIVLQNESGTSLKRKVASMYLAGYNIVYFQCYCPVYRGSPLKVNDFRVS